MPSRKLLTRFMSKMPKNYLKVKSCYDEKTLLEAIDSFIFEDDTRELSEETYDRFYDFLKRYYKLPATYVPDPPEPKPKKEPTLRTILKELDQNYDLTNLQKYIVSLYFKLAYESGDRSSEVVRRYPMAITALERVDFSKMNYELSSTIIKMITKIVERRELVSTSDVANSLEEIGEPLGYLRTGILHLIQENLGLRVE